MNKKLVILLSALICGYISYGQTPTIRGTPVNSGFQINAPLPVDMREGKWDTSVGAYRNYNSVSEAISSIPRAYRFKGLTIRINTGGVPYDYWWASGIENTDLLPKHFVGATKYDPTARALYYWNGSDWVLFVVSGTENADGYVLKTADGLSIKTVDGFILTIF